MVSRRLIVLLVLGVLLLTSVPPAEAQTSSRCRLVDVTGVRFSPDEQTYKVGTLVTVRATLKNFDTADYNLTLFSVLNNPQWSTSADGTTCGPAPQPASSSCAFNSNVLTDSTGKAPILVLRQRDIGFTAGTGNNTSTVTNKGPMPVDVIVQVTGEVPPISIQEERSFLRIRGERGGTEFCTAAAETRQITDPNLGRIEQCLSDGDDAVAKARRLLEREARDAGLRSSDLRVEEEDLNRADRVLGLARSDYKNLRGATENQTILANCNDAISLARRVESGVNEKIRGTDFPKFLWGTLVPVIVVVVVIILALMLLGRKRWDRL